MGYTSLSQLTSDDHWLVDAESRVVVSVTDRIVIEGRFLNFVLAGVPDVWLIALTCDDEIRAERHRIGEEFGLERYNAKEHDRDDARLRRMLYNDIDRPMTPNRTIDTTDTPLEEVVRRIAEAVGETDNA